MVVIIGTVTADLFVFSPAPFASLAVTAFAPATYTSTIILSHATNQAIFHHLGATQETNLRHIPEPLLTQADILQ